MPTWCFCVPLQALPSLRYIYTDDLGATALHYLAAGTLLRFSSTILGRTSPGASAASASASPAALRASHLAAAATAPARLATLAGLLQSHGEALQGVWSTLNHRCVW